MVGLPGEAVSNMAPPTAALLAQGIGICGLAVVLRPVMARVLARPRVWRSVVLAGPFAMTAFLWHLTALMTVLLALRALGVVQPSVASWQWWLTRPLLFTVLAVVTGLLVAVFVRFDRGPRTAADAAAEPRGWVDPVAAVSAGVLFFGILIVSIVGVDVLGNRPVFFLVGDVTPIVGFAVLGAGLLLLRARPAPAHPAPDARSACRVSAPSPSSEHYHPKETRWQRPRADPYRRAMETRLIDVHDDAVCARAYDVIIASKGHEHHWRRAALPRGDARRVASRRRGRTHGDVGCPRR